MSDINENSGGGIEESDSVTPRDSQGAESAGRVGEGSPPTSGRFTRGRTREFRHTRTSAAWTSTVIAVLFAIALVDFIAQNTHDLRIHFFTLSGKVPASVALLVAAVGGSIVVVAVGVGRVAQLRLTLRRQRKSGALGSSESRALARDRDSPTSRDE